MICVIRGFLVAYGKKSLEEIFVEMLLTQEICSITWKTKSLKKILTRMRSNTSLYGKG